MADDGIFEQYQACTWAVAGRKMTIPLEAIRERGGNRLVVLERPYREGAKLDDTGATAKVYELTVAIFNGNTEPDVGDAIYPDLVNQIVDSFDQHETGTLTLPTVGPRRCRAHTYERGEKYEERDTAYLQLVFMEDNEDSVTASSFLAPSARSVSRTLSEQTSFSLQSAGVYGDDVVSLTDFAAELETLLNAPGEYVADIDTKGKQMRAAAQRIEDAFTANRLATDTDSLLSNAQDGALPLRSLRKLADASARAVAERASSQPRLVQKKYKQSVSIFAVAAQVKQKAEDLMDVNPSIPDFLDIPAGTTILVFDQTSTS